MNPPTLKQTLHQSPKQLRHLSEWILFLAGTLAVMGNLTARASSIVKANNTDNLNLTTSWSGGSVPGSGDIAVWNGTVTGPNTVNLGASTTWSGIQIAGPGGLVTIANDGNTLTNGGSGIDMSAASQNLTLNNNVVLGTGPQNWTVASGRSLALGASLLRNSGASLRFYLPDLNASGAQVSVTNGTPNWGLGNTTNSTFGNVYFGTVNDIDFAGLNGSLQIVGGSTIGGFYTPNPGGGNAPTLNGTYDVIDFVNTASYGIRSSQAVTYRALRFNAPQTYGPPNPGAVAYNGVPAWQNNRTSGRNMTVYSILITTNVGGSAVIDNGGATTIIGTAGTRDLLLFQNNPAAPLILQNVVTETGTNNPAFLDKMGAGTVLLQANNTYSGGTRIYEGTLQVDAVAAAALGVSVRMPVSAFLGATNSVNVFGGTLAQATGNTNAVPVTVFSGGANAVLVNASNGQLIDGSSGRAETIFNSSTNFSLTYNSGSRVQFVYSNSIVPSTTVAPLWVTNAFAANPLTANGTVTVDVFCGALSLGQFPLIRYSGNIGGSGGSAFVLGTIEPHAAGYLSNNLAGQSIDLVVTNITQPIKWAAGNAVWDINLTSNWKDNLSNPTTYQQIGSMGDNVVFDDSASGSTPVTVTLNTNPIPNSVTVNNTAKKYVLSGNGSISGSGSFTKTGPGTLTLSTSNSFVGGLNINGGVLNFSTLTNLGAAGINFGGGTLQYASGNLDDISTRTVTFSAGGGTIDVNGNAVVLANGVGNNGAGGLTVTNGTLTLTATNRYSGNTVVSSGSTLAFQNNNTYLGNSAALIVNGTLNASATVNPDGFGLTLSTSAGQMLAGTGAVKGEVSTSTGTTISPATNGTIGTLTVNGDLTVNGGTLAMDIVGPSGASRDMLAINNSGFGSGNLTLGSGLSGGTVQLNITGGPLNNGTYQLISYSGTLGGAAGFLNLTGFSQSGQLAYLSSSASVNGGIFLNVISGNTNKVVWVGGNGANAWDVGTTVNWTVNGAGSGYFTNGNTATFDDTASSANATVGLKSTLLPAAMILNVTNNNYTFHDGSGTGAGLIVGSSSLTINGPALPTTNLTTILTPNGNSGPTVINGSGSILLVGDGTTTGDIGSGNVTNNGTLIFDQTDNRVVLGQISGSGKLIQAGSTLLALLANNSYAGQTIISNASSILQVGSGGAAGTLGTGAVTDNGMLLVNRSGSFTLSNVSGAGSVAFSGPAAITLGSPLTYLGGTFITNGSLKLVAANQIPNGVTVAGSTGILGLGGMLDLNGNSQTVNGLTDLGLGSGMITNSAAAGTTNFLTIGIPSVNASNTFSGLIVDNTNRAGVGLVINNPGTTVLTGQGNTFRGGIIVGRGTLQLGQGGPNINGGPAAGTGGIIMSNGTTFFLGGNNITFVANPVTIAPNSTVTFSEQVLAAYSDTYSGSVSGDALSTNVINNQFTFQGAGQWNSFSGTVLIPDGAGLRVYGATGGTNATFEIDGSGTMFSRNADTIMLGALSGDGSIITPSVTAGATYVIGSKGVDSTFRGTISGFNNIAKTGSGTLTLIGSTNLAVVTVDENFNLTTNYIATNGLSYVGSTIVSNGVLAIVAPANLNGGNSTNFVLAASSAVLDLSSMGYSPDGTTFVTNSTLTLASPQLLTGIGTIRGSVVAPNGVVVTVGFQPDTNGAPVTGLLNITNSVELGGAINMNLNRTNSSNCGEISSPTITIDSGATLTVTNVGPALQGGEVFHLFSGPVAAANFASVTLPTISSPLSWSNSLAADGTIRVLGSLVNTSAPYLTNTLEGSTLTLSWPATGYIGFWRLQSQTNTTSVGLWTNWVDVAGASATNKVIITVDPTKGAVFYRLIYP